MTHRIIRYVYDRDGFSDVCLLSSDGVCLEANGLTSYAYSPAVPTCSQFRNPNGSALVQWDASVPNMLNPILNASLPEVSVVTQHNGHG